MSHPFKVGDEVRCIEQDAAWASVAVLTNGGLYRVTQVTVGEGHPFVKLDGISGRWFLADRFELAVAYQSFSGDFNQFSDLPMVLS